jgi:hypothetical protein
MQPHIPFIGEFGRNKIGIYDGVTKGRNHALGNEYSPNEEPYVLLEQGKLKSSTVKKAYRENLKLTLSAVKPLFSGLDGKTIVTSDHGEMFGEIGWPSPKRHYGHPLYTAAISLHKVPWFVVESEDRREIFSEQPEGEVSVDDEHVEERLEELGYK